MMTKPARMTYSPSGTQPMAPAVRTSELDLAYGRHKALEGVSLEFGSGRIHGLLGRNGAGKTTLLSVIASLLPATRGLVEVGGRPSFEDAAAMSQVCLIRESGTVVGDERLGWNLEFQQVLRPGFDRDWAEDLVGRFGLNRKAKPNKMSRGQRSAVNAIVGLASRAPVTIFDEVHLGMDAAVRQLFTDQLLADFVERPRTIIISSHLIQEIEPLLETVTILHRGRVLLSAEADEVRSHGLTITGPAARVDAVAAQLTVVASRDLGPTRQITAYGPVDPAVLDLAARAGLTIDAAPLQDLFIHLTEES